MRKKETIKSVAIVGLVMVILLLSCAVIKSNQEKNQYKALAEEGEYYRTIVQENRIESEQLMTCFTAGSSARILERFYEYGLVPKEEYEEVVRLEEEFVDDPSYSKAQIYLDIVTEMIIEVTEKVIEENGW